MSNEDSTDKNPWPLTRKAPITAIGVLMLGIVGSTFYDLLVKPGLSTFGRLFLDVVTLGSQTAKDYAYASAALDPTPVTSLYLLQIFLIMACLPAERMIERRISKNKTFKRKLSETPDNQKIAFLKGEVGKLKWKVRILEFIFWTTFIPWLMAAIIAFSVHNQSVLIWRVFNADIAIITPHASDSEIKRLRSLFCSMKNRNDYIAIKNAINSIAEKNKIETRRIETW
jgi:hypothetical protein